MAHCPNIRQRNATRGFTLIELMVAIAILLVLGLITITFLRSAVNMTRTATSRGQIYQTAQTTLRLMEKDFSQVLGQSANTNVVLDDTAFLLVTDPFGRQVVMLRRAWGDELSTMAGYDAGFGAPDQGYGASFDGRNPSAKTRASGGNLDVVYLFEPLGPSTRLYRAERAAPPRGTPGLIDLIASWCNDFRGQRVAAPDDTTPMAALTDVNGNYTIDGAPAWDLFEMVSDDIAGFGVECWDDWDRTTTWFAGPSGPVTSWSIGQREAEGKYILPRALRLNLLVVGEEPLRAETTLAGAMNTGDGSAFVEETDLFPDVGGAGSFVRINGEVMAYGSRSGQTFGSLVRGALGTRAQDHAAGSTVLAGEMFQKVIQLPVTR
jgi:prepilin-type N-terminal cleavage/methylation domain-containing protein